MVFCLSLDLGFCSPFYLGYFAWYPGIACLGYVHYGVASKPPIGQVHSGMACLACDWFPLLGVHPSISIVKLIVIGYHCNCLDGQLNCWAFAHWLIDVTIMY